MNTAEIKLGLFGIIILIPLLLLLGFVIGVITQRDNNTAPVASEEGGA